MREACGAPKGTRPIFSMSYDDDGTEIVATVGEVDIVDLVNSGPGLTSVLQGLTARISELFSSQDQQRFTRSTTFTAEIAMDR
jgi:hypothetical protein